MVKKKEGESTFNIEEAITNLECSDMFKAGLRYYIESNKLTPKNDNEFLKIVKNYNKLKIGD